MKGNVTNESRGVEWGEGDWVPLEQPYEFTGLGLMFHSIGFGNLSPEIGKWTTRTKVILCDKGIKENGCGHIVTFVKYCHRQKYGIIN